MAGWEQILVGVAALLLLFVFWPGVKNRLENSPKGTTEDWIAVAKPLAAVVAFVVLLIALA